MTSGRFTPMDRLALRFVVAGIVIIVGGIAIATTGAGIGEAPEWKGALVAALGAGLIVSGVRRQMRRDTDC